MLFTPIRALCVAIALSSFTSIGSTRAVLSRSEDCADGNCVSDPPAPETGLTVLSGVSQTSRIDSRLSVDHVPESKVQQYQARAVPIIKPKPKDPFSSSSDPFNPASNPFNPASNPFAPKPSAPKVSAGSAPKVTLKPTPESTPAPITSPNDAEDPAIVAEICAKNLNNRRRSTCDTAAGLRDDSNTIGENPAIDDPAVVAAGSVDRIPQDFFALVKNSNPPENRARDDHARRISENVPDEPIPDVATFDNFYDLKILTMSNAFLSGGRNDVTKLIGDLDINAEGPGNLYMISSIAGRGGQFHLPTLETTWSDDGKIQFIDSAFKDADETIDGRIPSFKLSMHVGSHRIANVNDVSKLEGVGQAHIVNIDTKKTIDSIFEALNPTNVDNKVILSASAPAGSDEAHAFNAFMLTDNGRGSYWLLGNYHQAFGDKTVTEIRIFKPNEDAKLPYPAAFLRYGHLS